MSQNQNNKISINFSISTTIFLIFLVLKLVPGTAVNSWPWIWVLSPLWIPFLLCGIILLIIVLVWGIIRISKWVMYGK